MLRNLLTLFVVSLLGLLISPSVQSLENWSGMATDQANGPTVLDFEDVTANTSFALTNYNGLEWDREGPQTGWGWSTSNTLPYTGTNWLVNTHGKNFIGYTFPGTVYFNGAFFTKSSRTNAVDIDDPSSNTAEMIRLYFYDINLVEIGVSDWFALDRYPTWFAAEIDVHRIVIEHDTFNVFDNSERGVPDAEWYSTDYIVFNEEPGFEPPDYCSFHDCDRVIPTDEWINLYCGNPLLDGVPMTPGVVLQTFDPQRTLCGADTIKEDGSFGFLKVYRDDPDTDWDEGAEPGDPITFTVEGVRVTTDPSIVWDGNGTVFEVCSFSTEDICTEISLLTGWNLVSWNVAYEAEIQETLQDIIEHIDIVLSFDEGGLTFDPDLPQFSDLDSVGFHRGYWFRMDSDATLTICGSYIPREEHIVIHRGWNLVSYWPEIAWPTTSALASIITNVAFAYGFDSGIEVWTPSGGPFNTLNELRPSLGYWIKSYNPDILAYPGFSGASQTRQTESPRAFLKSQPQASRYWMALYGEDIELNNKEIGNGTLLQIQTVNGNVCGHGTYWDGLLRFTPVYTNFFFWLMMWRSWKESPGRGTEVA